jgi:hypothetical protein
MIADSDLSKSTNTSCDVVASPPANSISYDTVEPANGVVDLAFQSMSKYVRVPSTHAGFVNSPIVVAKVIVSVLGVIPLPTAEVSVIIMPPVPGNAKAVGVSSDRVEKFSVLGFVQITAEAFVAAARTTARTTIRGICFFIRAAESPEGPNLTREKWRFLVKAATLRSPLLLALRSNPMSLKRRKGSGKAPG